MRSVPGGDRLFTANPVSRRRRGERARTAWPYGAAVRRGVPGAGGSGATYRIRATIGARGRPGKAARCPFGRPLSGSPVGIHVKFRPDVGFSGTKVHRWRRVNRSVAPRPAPRRTPRPGETSRWSPPPRRPTGGKATRVLAPHLRAVSLKHPWVPRADGCEPTPHQLALPEAALYPPHTFAPGGAMTHECPDTTRAFCETPDLTPCEGVAQSGGRTSRKEFRDDVSDDPDLGATFCALMTHGPKAIFGEAPERHDWTAACGTPSTGPAPTAI